MAKPGETAIKQKIKPISGFKAADIFRVGFPSQTSKFSGKLNAAQTKFNPSQFRTQHKGG